jgi:hypothetical protein
MNFAKQIWFTLLCVGWAAAGHAESAIPLLSGFDAQRIDTVYPAGEEQSIGELAKLVSRLRTVDPQSLRARIGDPVQPALGDAIEIEGMIETIQSLPVPLRLVEFLDLATLQLLAVAVEGERVYVVTSGLPADAAAGDRVRGAAVVIEVDAVTPGSESSAGKTLLVAVACPRLNWFPEKLHNASWQLLRDAGVDVSLLAEVAERNRRPLLREDGDAFYTILAAAAQLADRDNLPQPASVTPIDLLRGPEGLTGDWLRLKLETVQITRIAVAEPARQAQLGSDHYYQIDAFGDLGNVIIKIEPPAGQNVPPVEFENRYPVSVVVRELPAALRQAMAASGDGQAVLTAVRMMVEVDGFFFRLWSYETDFMKQQGGGEQFGPLLMAAHVRSLEPASRDPAGVHVIGMLVAAAVIGSILAIWLWNRRLSSQDRQVSRKRQARQAEQLWLPP